MYINTSKRLFGPLKGPVDPLMAHHVARHSPVLQFPRTGDGQIRTGDCQVRRGPWGEGRGGNRGGWGGWGAPKIQGHPTYKSRRPQILGRVPGHDMLGNHKRLYYVYIQFKKQWFEFMREIIQSDTPEFEII